MKKDGEIKLLLDERAKGMTQKLAAARSGMCERTARNYERVGKLPSQMKKPSLLLNLRVPSCTLDQSSKSLKGLVKLEAPELFPKHHKGHLHRPRRQRLRMPCNPRMLKKQPRAIPHPLRDEASSLLHLPHSMRSLWRRPSAKVD